MHAGSGISLDHSIYRQFHDLIPLEMFLLDRNGGIQYANTVFWSCFPNLSLGASFQSIVATRHHAKVAEMISRACESSVQEQEQIEILGKDRLMEMILKYDPQQDLLFGMLTPEPSARQKIVDPLTGLPNRELFMDRLEQIILRADREKSRVAVLFLDLDGFKPVNDTHGHRAGDMVLKNLAGRMQESMRKIDTVSRFGGDEFIIALSDIKEGIHASLSAKRILNRIEESHLLDQGRRISVSASIGIALYPDDDTSPSGLIRKADEAMYRAKKNKTRYQFYDMNKICR